MLALGVSLEIVPVNLLVHAVLFAVALFFMSRFLLRPINRVLTERDEAIAKRRARAEATTIQADQLESAYRGRLEVVKHEAREIKEGLRREGFTQAATIMERARNEASQRLDAAKQELQQAAEQAKAVLQADVRQFSRLIAERILERGVQSHDDVLPDNALGESTARKANSQ